MGCESHSTLVVPIANTTAVQNTRWAAQSRCRQRGRTAHPKRIHSHATTTAHSAGVHTDGRGAASPALVHKPIASAAQPSNYVDKSQATHTRDISYATQSTAESWLAPVTWCCTLVLPTLWHTRTGGCRPCTPTARWDSLTVTCRRKEIVGGTPLRQGGGRRSHHWPDTQHLAAWYQLWLTDT